MELCDMCQDCCQWWCRMNCLVSDKAACATAKLTASTIRRLNTNPHAILAVSVLKMHTGTQPRRQ
jgi:hypothetical protein